MSMIAVENCCNACSSAAAASGEAASVGRLGVAARESDAGEPGICVAHYASGYTHRVRYQCQGRTEPCFSAATAAATLVVASKAGRLPCNHVLYLLSN